LQIDIEANTFVVIFINTFYTLQYNVTHFKIINMGNFFCSSIGKKLLMSLAGIFLAVFLLVHLGINLTLLLNDGGAAFRTGVEFMTTNPLIKIMEIVLFGGFLIHIIWGIFLQIQNWLARPSRYAITNNSQTSFFSKYMIHTGAVIGVFLVLHFMNFYFVKLGITNAPQGVKPVEGPHDFYNMAINLFTQPAYSIIYICFMAFLSFHLNHAFQSAFQTIGVNHSKYTPAIKWIGLAYSIIVPAGFAIIPIYFLCFWK
jgi:succinate dehydrogenase / fumarate reductase, cytochrome b subunit